jgi:hypothetical protein
MKTAHHRFAVAILALLVLPVPAWDAVAEEDPIKAELDAARFAYAKAISVANVIFIAAFDRELKTIAAAGDLDGYKALHADKKKTNFFPESTLDIPADLPETDVMHGHQLTYTNTVRMARNTLAAALDAGVKKYTMKVEIEKATAVQKKWRSLLGFRPIGYQAAQYYRTTKRILITDKSGYLESWQCKSSHEFLHALENTPTPPGENHPSRAYYLSVKDLSIGNLARLGGGGHLRDWHLRDLRDLRALERLEINSTHISDTGLVHLKDLPNLSKLLLLNTKITSAGVENLQKALPKCKIEWNAARPKLK